MSLLLLDVNILLAAHRREHVLHAQARQVVDVAAADGFALCAHTRNGFLRLATHPVMRDPTPIGLALDTVPGWLERPATRRLSENDPKVWEAFDRLCRTHAAQANAVYDLHLASLAIAHRCILVSDDRGFDRIGEVRWKPPEAVTP